LFVAAFVWSLRFESLFDLGVKPSRRHNDLMDQWIAGLERRYATDCFFPLNTGLERPAYIRFGATRLTIRAGATLLFKPLLSLLDTIAGHEARILSGIFLDALSAVHGLLTAADEIDFVPSEVAAAASGTEGGEQGEIGRPRDA